MKTFTIVALFLAFAGALAVFACLALIILGAVLSTGSSGSQLSNLDTTPSPSPVLGVAGKAVPEGREGGQGGEVSPTTTPPDLTALDLPLPFKRVMETGPYTFYDYANDNYTLTLQLLDKQGGVYDSGEFVQDVREGPNYIRAYNEALMVDGELLQPAYISMRFDITLAPNMIVSGQISRLLPQPDGQYRAGLLSIFEALLAALN
jgi:hypothetical protein